MGVIMEGFRRNDRGGITISRFDSDSFPGPSNGWYDSPDKVPALFRLGQLVVPPEGFIGKMPDAPVPEPVAPVASKSEQAIIESNGTAALIPKQRGWPKGRLRGPRKVA